MAQAFKKLDDSTNTISESPVARSSLLSDIRQNAWSLPSENTNECMNQDPKPSLSKKEESRSSK